MSKKKPTSGHLIQRMTLNKSQLEITRISHTGEEIRIGDLRMEAGAEGEVITTRVPRTPMLTFSGSNWKGCSQRYWIKQRSIAEEAIPDARNQEVHCQMLWS
jgi:hypothetical protein